MMRRLALLGLLILGTTSALAVEQGQPAPCFAGSDISGNEVPCPLFPKADIRHL